MPKATLTHTASTPGRAIHTPPLAYAAPLLIQAAQPDDELGRLLARHRHLNDQLAALSAGAAAIADDNERTEQVRLIETVQGWLMDRIVALADLAADVRLAA